MAGKLVIPVSGKTNLPLLDTGPTRPVWPGPDTEEMVTAVPSAGVPSFAS